MPLPLSAHADDPILDTIARSIFTLFPRCMKCGARIERYEDAEVRILANRVVHRGACPVVDDRPGAPLPGE